MDMETDTANINDNITKVQDVTDQVMPTTTVTEVDDKACDPKTDESMDKDVISEDDDDFEDEIDTVGKVIDCTYGEATVVKTIKKLGEGFEKPQKGQEVTVNYAGRLHDTQVQFDANDGFTFTLGSGVIEGWSDAVATMKKGEKSTIIIQPTKGYGAQGAGSAIPPNATLEFDIELVSWVSEEDLSSDKNGTLLMKTIKEAEKELFKKPTELSTVTVDYTLKTADGREISKGPTTFVVDDGDESIPLGLEVAVKNIKLNQVVSLNIVGASCYSFQSPHAQGGVDLWYDQLTLTEMNNPKEQWGMTPDEKLSECEMLRLKGNDAFKKGVLPRAVRRYEGSVSCVEWLGNEATDEQKQQATLMALPSHLNLAQCYLKQQEYQLCISKCDKALEIDSNSSKAFFRQGMAFFALKDFISARSALRQACILLPTDGLARLELKKVEETIEKEKQLEKKTYGGMFNKIKGFASDGRDMPSNNNKDEGGNEFEDYDGDDDCADGGDGGGCGEGCGCHGGGDENMETPAGEEDKVKESTQPQSTE
eukprot:GHVR01136688.1.p1 GENE.GHVR01136688.1~~GHVR01136688.1.p1  ORF type:complete len:556 (+),score=174.98 GHVR01136688.1:60-1670(+)